MSADDVLSLRMYLHQMFVSLDLPLAYQSLLHLSLARVLSRHQRMTAGLFDDDELSSFAKGMKAHDCVSSGL